MANGKIGVEARLCEERGKERFMYAVFEPTDAHLFVVTDQSKIVSFLKKDQSIVLFYFFLRPRLRVQCK